MTTRLQGRLVAALCLHTLARQRFICETQISSCDAIRFRLLNACFIPSYHSKKLLEMHDGHVVNFKRLLLRSDSNQK